jgi:REP element-mobilizing transposase RayT
VHLTLRARAGLPSLRSQRVFRALQAAFVAARGSLTNLRVVHFSVQTDHLHLLVEAPDRDALCFGARGLAIRLARAINRVLGRAGAVWGDRYHMRAMRTPREVRHGLVYVLMNFKKHLRGARGLDPMSSAAALIGLRDPVPEPDEALLACVYRPRTWLLHSGWRRHGLLSNSETPRRAV